MRFERTEIAGGFILADAALTPRAEWFEPQHWKRRGAGEPLGAGRGIAVSAGEAGAWALRHYHRGGWPGRFVADSYLWRGAERARPVRELRLLAALRERGAPVVQPVAARVLRAGLRYRGDILTQRIRDSRTLGSCARTLEPEDWARIGEAIRRLHEAGGWHADLNAHNILLTPCDVFVLDLDRGRLVPSGSRVQRRNLDRLQRSLGKLGLLPPVASGWQTLLSAYRSPSKPK
ncbi:MAG TPA: 3-deoxy-D-manno-octulosonic acid kinase [Gammaproteobacteria bacterium]|nr:3-deoxy-D-manno-octulosonic acid kinase [Gammaproteobacteria bacterium]